jgi:hypothetical protein
MPSPVRILPPIRTVPGAPVRTDRPVRMLDAPTVSAKPQVDKPQVNTIDLTAVDALLRQLNASAAHDFVVAARLVGALEAFVLRMNAIDKLAVGRLMISAGHNVTLTCTRPR